MRNYSQAAKKAVKANSSYLIRNILLSVMVLMHSIFKIHIFQELHIQFNTEREQFSVSFLKVPGLVCAINCCLCLCYRRLGCHSLNIFTLHIRIECGIGTKLAAVCVCVCSKC